MSGLEEFTAKRRTDQADLETLLLPFVHDALEQRAHTNWTDDLIRFISNEYLDVYRSEGGKALPPAALRQFLADVKTTLDKTNSDSEVTAERIAVWLATAILNAATLEATGNDEEFLVLEWVTMHDGHVRISHKDAEGQQRPPGEPFDVGGEKLRYPGDPTASVSLWINCRCAARPAHMKEAALVADAEAHNTGRCIVAIPADGDPSHDLSMEDPTHCTLIWLGTPDENPDLDIEAINQEVALTAAATKPFAAQVTGIDQLGGDGALVWMLDDTPAAVRDRLLPQTSVKRGHEAVKQYPNFTPHTTIGYDVPMSADGIDALSSVKEIRFDRFGVWDGDDKQEYPMGAQPQEDTMPDQPVATEPMAMEPLMWHGVIAPENEWSGDGRMFATDSLTWRDLPLPLTWQKTSAQGHSGSVVVAKIEAIARVDGEMRASGSWLSIPEADEAIGLVCEFGRFGVSVDADDVDASVNEDSGQVTFSKARIASAALVPIPAFFQAWVAMGPAPADFGLTVAPCDPNDPTCEDSPAYALAASWDGSASRFTPEQWKKSCVLHLADTLNKSDHKLPIRDPGGAINKGGVHAAASRFNQVDAPAEAKASAKSALRGAYKQIGEPVPDILASAAVVTAGRGPGWVTNPEDTRRLWNYWVHGEGAAKVDWGTPGDFNRCRIQVGEEIGEGSPEKLRFLNQICAQWHHDATGFWPGHAPAEQALEGDPAPALTLVAAGGHCAPSEWFVDPGFTDDDPRLVEQLDGKFACPVTITADGRVFGHIAYWGQCHIGYQGVCVTPPHSESGYAFFLTGATLTDQGLVPTGPITVGGGHAREGLSARAAIAHYDSTSTAGCDVAAGEDAYGIWVAGWTRPGVPDELVAAIRASGPSGDWREVAPGRMELVAALSVNVQGFPVCRIGIRAGQQVSLVAAGVVSDRQERELTEVEKLAMELATEMRRIESRREKMMALAARVNGD